MKKLPRKTGAFLFYTIFWKLLSSLGREIVLRTFICPSSLMRMLWGLTSPIFFFIFSNLLPARIMLYSKYHISVSRKYLPSRLRFWIYDCNTNGKFSNVSSVNKEVHVRIRLNHTSQPFQSYASTAAETLSENLGPRILWTLQPILYMSFRCQ